MMIDMQLNPEELNDLANKRLGIFLKMEDHGSIQDIGRIPQSVIDNAKRLENPYLMVEYLSFYLPESQWPFIKAFVFQDILGGKDRTAPRGGTWIACIPLEEQLTQTREMIFSPFETSIGDIITPDIELWRNGGGFAGTLVFTILTGAYEWTINKRFLPLAPNRVLIMIEQNEIPIWFRRWIAQGIARHLLIKGELQYPIHMSSLEEIADPSTWTEDAKKAIAGLERELHHGLDLEHTVPGYGGPNEWYY